MKKALLFFVSLILSIGMALAQKTTFSGIVISAEDGQPIIGALVLAKGEKGVGGQTNLEGKFSFQASTSVKYLIVSYVGMKTQEVPAGKNLKITLQPDAVMLEGVVVTGMGVKRSQKSLGYSVQQVKAEELRSTRTADLNNALAGKIAGARFVGGSGATFDPGRIVLRGTSSLDPRGSEPIYVVDGVITNKNMVNMDDVVNINVLKGPAATAIYGSEGGNGAIIITTRGGQGGGGEGTGSQTLVEISHSTTFEQPINHFNFQQEYGGGYLGANPDDMPVFTWEEGMDPRLKVLNGQRYYDYSGDGSWGPRFDGKPYVPFYAWDPTDPEFGTTVPWQAHGRDNILNLFRTGVTHTTNVAFARAGEDHMTRVSFTNIDRKGIALNSDAVRRFLSIKTSFRPHDRILIDLDYKYTYRENHNAANEEYGNLNPVYSLTQWGNVNVDLRDLKKHKTRPDGSFRSWNITGIDDFQPAYHNNPYAILEDINRYNRYSWNVFTASATLDITKKIKATASLFGNLRNYQGETFVPSGLIGDDVLPYYGQTQDRTMDIRTQGKLSYSDRYFDDRFTLDLAAYAEDRRYRYDELKAGTKDGLAAPGWYNLAASTQKPLVENSKMLYRTQSVFGTATLGFKDTYYADLSARNDWSSTLPDANNSYFFGGASLSAIVSNILPKMSWLNFWKVRGSIAQVGSTMAAYQVYQTYDTGKFGNTTYMNNIQTLYNPEIRPTISTSMEVGTEFRMFENRFWGDINLYRRVARDQIINLNVSSHTGFSYKKLNAGKILNEGVEVSLGGSPIKTKNWQWDLNFNIAKNVNKLLELDGVRQDYRVDWYGYGSYLYNYAEVGQPIGVLRGNNLKYDEQGRLVLRKREKAHPEYGEYAILVDSEAKNIGNIQPDFTGGFSTSLRYKSLTLRAAFDFQIGGQLGSTTNMFGTYSGLTAQTAGTNDRGGLVRDPWNEKGGVHVVGVDEEGNPVDTYVGAQYYYLYRIGSLWGPNIFDCSYVKMRELAISYDLPRSLVDRTGFLKSASVSLVANNPWLIYSGMPNIDASETGNAYGGFLETGQSISSRTLGCTINLTF